MSRIFLASIVFTSVACTRETVINRPDAGAETADAGSICTGAALKLDETFQIDPVGKYEIVASTVFDGTIWAAYSRGDTSGATNNFQVWLTNLRCDGSVLVPPTQVSTDMANDVDPVIAISGSVVAVAWLSDSGQFPNNLTIKYRLYNRDTGVAISPDQLTLQTTREEAPVDTNMLEPSIAPVPGGFVIAGTRSSADEMTFQTYAQRIDLTGATTGPTIDANLETDASHDNATVGALPDGTLYLAWGRESQDGLNSLPLMHTSVAPGSDTPAPASEEWHEVIGSYPTISTAPSVTAHSYLAFQALVSQSEEVMITDAAQTATTLPGLQIVVPGTTAVGPHVAASDDGGAVAWMTEDATNHLSVLVQRFVYDGTNWQTGKRVQIEPMVKFAQRPPTLTRLGGNTYVVTWTEGSGADTFTYARLVSLDD